MEHFARVVMEKIANVDRLDESIFPKQIIYETEQGQTVIQMPLARNLLEQEADEFAKRLANYMFEQGYTDFDIEISMSEEDKSFDDRSNIQYNENKAKHQMVKINEIADQKLGEEMPYDVGQDLIIYMRNEPMFYRQHLYPALIDVQETLKSGKKYNKRQMLPVIEKAIQNYVGKFGIKKLPEELMNDREKIECISNLLKDEVENFKKGAY